ncbi:hypothetical protein BROUX41_003891 [Berkeleyomyces rouxiae]|uniref:uncharacterized protein n=1 Tax=Berkeleyomyces rouxiae TaxID=2035830 RepID=UPI003B82364F
MAPGRGRGASQSTANGRHDTPDNIRDDESLSSLTSLDDDDSTSDTNPPPTDRPPIRSPSQKTGSPPPPPPEVEWLATSRSRRSTAGNRMKSMLANEASTAEDPDSDLELLFAEDENDAGFVYQGNDDDLHLDSSSDDEDNENTDELEGERELEKLDKAARLAARKRRAQAAIPTKFRKKVRIQPPTDSAATTESRASSTADSSSQRASKKRSERTSWLPSLSDMPTRASERKTTRISKEQLHQRMRESEERRKKLVAAMERQAKKREALKKPPLTQEQRLAEAALVEKRNAKSLNRWEEAEKQREEERRAKLAALNNRTLKGPVITYWSGIREWNDNMNGAHMALEEKPKRKRVAKAEKEKEKPATDVATSTGASDKDTGDVKNMEQPVNPDKTDNPLHHEATSQSQPGADSTSAAESGHRRDADGDVTMVDASPTPLAPPPQTQTPAPLAPQSQTPTKPTPTPSTMTAPAGLQLPPGFAPPSTDSQIMPPPPMSRETSTVRLSGSALAAPVLAPPQGVPDLLEESLTLSMGMSAPVMSPGGFLVPPFVSAFQRPILSEIPPTTNIAAGSAPSPAPGQALTVLAKPLLGGASTPVAVPKRPSVDSTAEKEPASAAPEATPTPIVAEPSRIGENMADKETKKKPAGPAMRTAYILQNFDENVIKDKTVQTQILFGQKMSRIAKPQAPALCVITNMPAKYRDPLTGLPYYDAYAYKQIQKLRKGEFNWSRLLGAYVGSTTAAAQNVPARFLMGKALPKEEKKPEETKAKEDGELKKASDHNSAPKTDSGAAPETKSQPGSISEAPIPAVPKPAGGSNSTPAPAAAAPIAPVSTAPPAATPMPMSTAKPPSTGGSTILQPPIVPLTQPHLLKPPPPAGLPSSSPATLPPQPLPLPIAPLINGQAWGIPRPPPVATPRARTRQPGLMRSTPTKPAAPTPLSKAAVPTSNLHAQAPNAFHGLAPRPAGAVFRPVTTAQPRPTSAHPNPASFLAQQKPQGFTGRVGGTGVSASGAGSTQPRLVNTPVGAVVPSTLSTALPKQIPGAVAGLVAPRPTMTTPTVTKPGPLAIPQTVAANTPAVASTLAATIATIPSPSPAPTALMVATPIPALSAPRPAPLSTAATGIAPVAPMAPATLPSTPHTPIFTATSTSTPLVRAGVTSLIKGAVPTSTLTPAAAIQVAPAAAVNGAAASKDDTRKL